jgi:hypothetical protein
MFVLHFFYIVTNDTPSLLLKPPLSIVIGIASAGIYKNSSFSFFYFVALVKSPSALRFLYCLCCVLDGLNGSLYCKCIA